MIDATMNCLPILVRGRPAIANKIISAVLNFNPLKQASAPLSPKMMVIVRSMERTTRALLRNINKHNPNGPMAAKIDSYLLRLNQSRIAIFAETPSLKRPAPNEPTDGLDDTKRIRLTGASGKFPAMPPPPNTLADLFTLTQDAALKAFDVKLLPSDIVTTIATALLQHIEQGSLSEAVEAVKARYTHLQKAKLPTPIPEIPLAGPTGIDDEDDYDPEYEPGVEVVPAAATEKVLDELAHQSPALELGPFELPKPPPITPEGADELFHQSVNQVFGVLALLETHSSHRQKLGLNRLAASSNDRDAWVTMLTRLATRAPAGLDEVVKMENDNNAQNHDGDETALTTGTVLDIRRPSLANDVRQILFMYTVDNFRPRLNVAISWLNEEWYNDKLQARVDDRFNALPNYYGWTVKLLDNLLPYLDAKDKNLLIRFLSEIPAINEEILERVKSLARDPERVNICIMALQYLLMFRPPIRKKVVDTIESIWRDGDFAEAKNAAAKVLSRWRPEILEDETSGEGMEGVKQERDPTNSDGKDKQSSTLQTNGVKTGRSIAKVEREAHNFDQGGRTGSRTPTIAVGGEDG